MKPGTAVSPFAAEAGEERDVGEETRQFATRFSRAVSLLATLASEGGPAQLEREHGRRLASAVRDALDAVEAVYGTGTSAVRDWPERSRAVLARIAEARRALQRSGVDAEVRRLAAAVVALIEPGAPRG
ncbi:MAG TPA: hypothetical protein VFL83_16715 [Anaeromyxobacter sp.]|nr:hypothetical protein [Anaeromyxobacter sp.]